jgi:hypothetical protein
MFRNTVEISGHRRPRKRRHLSVSAVDVSMHGWQRIA